MFTKVPLTFRIFMGRADPVPKKTTSGYFPSKHMEASVKTFSPLIILDFSRTDLKAPRRPWRTLSGTSPLPPGSLGPLKLLSQTPRSCRRGWRPWRWEWAESGGTHGGLKTTAAKLTSATPWRVEAGTWANTRLWCWGRGGRPEAPDQKQTSVKLLLLNLQLDWFAFPTICFHGVVYGNISTWFPPSGSTNRRWSYLGSVGLQFWKDLRVNHVELRLDLVAADVVDRTRVFVHDQVFRWGRKPAEQKNRTEIKNKSSVWRKSDEKPNRPLHPFLVLIRLQEMLRSHVDHQNRRVFGSTRLIPEEDGSLLSREQGHSIHENGIIWSLKTEN